jgi:DNA-binding Lrp family transcriptional regulator
MATKEYRLDRDQARRLSHDARDMRSLLVDQIRHLIPKKDSRAAEFMRIWRMRTGISITVTPSDRLQLEALVRDRNAPQKQVWRAEIALLSADGLRLGWRIRPVSGQLKVADILRGLPEIVECDRIIGEDCFIARAHVPSVEHLEPIQCSAVNSSYFSAQN